MTAQIYYLFSTSRLYVAVKILDAKKLIIMTAMMCMNFG